MTSAGPLHAVGGDSAERTGGGANYALFAIMSLIWGSTWIAAKAGVSETPPLFFATARFVVGVACLVAFVRGFGAAFAPPLRGRVVVSGLLVGAGTYGLLFWGMQTVASGVAVSHSSPGKTVAGSTAASTGEATSADSTTRQAMTRMPLDSSDHRLRHPRSRQPAF